MKSISNSRISQLLGKTGIFCNMGEKAQLFSSLSSVGEQQSQVSLGGQREGSHNF